MSNAFEALISVAFILFIVVVALAAAGHHAGVDTPRGESEYTGYVVDVEHNKGLVLKTTQVHMKTQPRSSSKETFCVMDKKTDHLQALRNALTNQSRVTISYSRPVYVSRFNCNPGLSIVRNVTNEQ